MVGRRALLVAGNKRRTRQRTGLDSIRLVAATPPSLRPFVHDAITFEPQTLRGLSVLDVLRSSLAFGIVALASFGIGRPMLRKCAPELVDPLATFVWSTALGLSVAGSALLALACTGLLYADAVILLSAPACLWGLLELACLPIGGVRRELYTRDSDVEPANQSADWPAGTVWILTAAAVIAGAALLVALAPPTSHEALSRSLETPKNLLLEHGIATKHQGVAIRTNIAQMWFLWGLALEGPVAAGLVQWGLGVLLALATVLLARVFLPQRPAWLAGGLVLLAPGVQRHLGIPLEDLAFALFGTLSLEFVARVVVRLETGRSAILGGITLGTALAVQLSGFPLAAALGVAWIVACRPGREFRADLVRQAGLMGVIALIVAGPWLVQAILARPDSSGQSLQSVIAHVGPAMVAALLGLLLVRRLLGLDLLLTALAIYTALSATIAPSTRWWALVACWASVAVCWVWLELDEFSRGARRAGIAVLCLLAIACPVLQCGTTFNTLAVAVGWESRRDYLIAREPTYQAAWWFNRIQRPGDRLLAQDPRAFYFNCPTAATVGGRGHDAQLPPAQDLKHWIAAARQGGYSYLLAAEPLEPGQSPAGTHDDSSGHAIGPSRNYAELSRDGQVIPILEYCFADDNSRRIRYSLLRLR